MSAHLFLLQLSVQVVMSVSASLPAPHAVKMIAVEANYMLQWYCNYTQLENLVTFTAEFTHWHERNDEGSYKRVCGGSCECRCDFTHVLDFSSWFAIRVRAEAGLKHSKWTTIKFTPDQEVVLMSPRVNVTADKEVLTLTVSKSVLRNTMKLRYRVQYWERRKPEQEHMENYTNPHVPLRSLKSCTEYCVQVSVFSPYGISSNYSSPQCVSTTGCQFGWLGLLVVLPLLGAFICYKFRGSSTEYTAPESILVIQSAPSLLEVQEECWTVAQVIPLATKPTHTLQEEQEEEPTAELQAQDSLCQCSDGGLMQDSGFSSGLES